jgi:DNA-directed RNA polymerase specialized sigma24 family protein
MMTDHGASDDEALVGSCECGERFEKVFELRSKEIWRYLALRLGAPAADELLSEVFARAFAARARFDPRRGSARAWLYGIANNLCRERIRSDSQYRRLLQRAEPELGNQTAPMRPSGSRTAKRSARRSTGFLRSAARWSCSSLPWACRTKRPRRRSACPSAPCGQGSSGLAGS